eukprot:360180-Chlamydomonas_euryale.AAC.7
MFVQKLFSCNRLRPLAAPVRRCSPRAHARRRDRSARRRAPPSHEHGGGIHRAVAGALRVRQSGAQSVARRGRKHWRKQRRRERAGRRLLARAQNGIQGTLDMWRWAD